MPVDLYGFAQRIIDASHKLESARDPQAALDALDALNNLSHDHEMLHLLALSFQLTSSALADELSAIPQPPLKTPYRVDSTLNEDGSYRVCPELLGYQKEKR
ncbi:hypothetical protein VDR48_19855 [Xanthomonas campestris pv. campestris]|nr:hypothetical protein [Xanthomonas campestris pv. campestris]MEB1789631.1 hypothetical protein [Xanthomonas campestris pv. campestris]MEB1844513.1 hypothetical protein [Xanthomonas campestris pv. campestris]MEB1878273.1 hypothetical protein [Xanthomonas campestris pv. campestris]